MLSPQQFGDLHSDLMNPKVSGFTVDPKTGERPTTGWMVSRPGHEEKYRSYKGGPERLSTYADKHEGALSEPGAHMGGWHSQGTAYLDVSHRHEDTHKGGVEAIVDMHRHHQEAIYNLGADLEMSAKPSTRGQRSETRKAMNHIRDKRPGGEGKPISDMPPSDLAAAIRTRRPVSWR